MPGSYKLGPLVFRTQSLAGQAFYAFLLLAAALPAAWLFNPLLSRVALFPEWIAALVISAVGLVLSIYLLHCLGRMGMALAPLFACILVIFTYITDHYNVEPGPSFIGAIAETTGEEVTAYLNFSTVAIVSASVCAYSVIVWKTRRLFAHLNIFIVLFFVLHALTAQSRVFTGNASKDMRHAAKWSMEYIADPIKYAFDYYYSGEHGKTDMLRSLPDPAVLPASRIHNEPLILIFVVGEALRADHLGINGYHRDTTPGLAREQLVNFPKMRSFAAWTRESVIGIFSDRPPETVQSRHGSFVKIFQKLGFSVTTYSANTKPNKSDYSFAILTEGAKRFYSPRPDMLMVKQLAARLGRQPLELHILSPYGSHFAYKDGYPPEEAVFTPDTYSRSMPPEELPFVINSYDNTVVYTDKMTCALINLVREQNAIVVYVSDHGESLGEEGRFFHGNNNAPEQRQVPFFIWFSDKYREAHPEIVKGLQARTGEQVHHANIFHTMLGMAGIESPVRDKVLDLTAPNDKPQNVSTPRP